MLLEKLNNASSTLKRHWARQHFVHLVLAAIGFLITAATLFVTFHGFYVYLSEAPARIEQARLLRLQIINSAWDTIRTTKGALTERGQTFALSTLVEANISVAGIDLSSTAYQPIDLSGADLSRANLAATRFSHTSFRHAHLGAASLQEAILDTVSMENLESAPRNVANAILMDSVISLDDESDDPDDSGIDLHGAIVVQTTLTLELMPVDLSGACIVGSRFIHVDRSSDDEANVSDSEKVRFAGSYIFGGTFEHDVLDNIDFRGTVFQSPKAFIDYIQNIQEPREGYFPSVLSRTEVMQLAQKRLVPPCMIQQRDVLATANLIDGDIEKIVEEGNEPGWTNELMKKLGGGRFQTDFRGASLKGARFEGVDMRNSTGITQAAIDSACVDDHTILPKGLVLPKKRCLPADSD